MLSHKASSDDVKKLRGAITAELLREEISNYLNLYDMNVAVSTVNSYIAGSKYEYDLLLVKKSAIPYMGILYLPEDVIAIVECKAGGLFDVDKDTDNIAKAVNSAQNINNKIRFGYITISENVPINEYNYYGKPTIKHWDLTVKYLNEKIHGMNASYAVTLHQGKNLCDKGTDEEFTRFVDFLVGDSRKGN